MVTVVERVNGSGAFRAEETLRDGRRATIRALQPGDREALLEAFGRTGDASRYTRFFAPKRAFTDREIDFFVKVDFASHMALVAELEEYLAKGERLSALLRQRLALVEEGEASNAD